MGGEGYSETELFQSCGICGTEQELRGYSIGEMLVAINHWNANHVTGHTEDERAIWAQVEISARYHEALAHSRHQGHQGNPDHDGGEAR